MPLHSARPTHRTAPERAPGVAPQELVALACRAPSIANSQPWAWRVRPDHVTLYPAPERALPEDPEARGLVLSCGTALQHLVWAARCHGLRTEVDLLPPDDDRALARVHLRGRPSGAGSAPVLGTRAAEDLALLHQRCTDRRRFTGWPVPPTRIDELLGVAVREGARAAALVDVAHRFRLETLLHRTAEGGEAPTGATTVGRGEGLLLIGSERDDVRGWLRAGQALGALWLEATRAGLSVVPVSRVIETPQVRREIEHDLLGDAFRPHLLLRVGWQAIGRSDLPRTARRPLADVLLD